MKIATYYTATADQNPPGQPLTEATECAVLVIGAGFAGLSAATGLVERGMRDVVVCEAQQVGFGASGRNGGFIFGGYSLGEEALLRQQGAQRAREMYQLTLDGCELIYKRTQRYAIDCELKRAGVLLTDWFGDSRPMHAKSRLMADIYGADWQFLGRDATRQCLNTPRYHSALLETQAAHFHPLKYAQGLAGALRQAGVAVYEQTPVQELRRTSNGYEAVTPEGLIRAERVVIACGGYIHEAPGRLQAPASRAILPIATYVAVTEPLGDRLREFIRGDWAVYDTRFAFDYYRPLAQGRLLWGGRISIRRPDNNTLERWLRRDLARVFPELARDVRFDYAWQGLMGYTRHQMPVMRESSPGLWNLVGFGGHGVATTSGLGDLMAGVLMAEDDRHRWFDEYGLAPTYGPLGQGAAQLSYWRAQTSDWLKEQWWRFKTPA